MNRISISVIYAALLTLPLTATAQKPITYPAKGQSSSQQNKDDAECAAWAQKSTGIDPAAVASTPPPQQAGPGGERARGAARGAVGGAAIGAITGDAGKGAGVGAVAGTMAGGNRARQNQAARDQQAQTQKNATIDQYYRAYGACMTGRGYSVS